MSKSNFKSKEEKIMNASLDCQVICKCSRRFPFPPNLDERICDWCGRKVKNTSRSRFRYMFFKERNANDSSNNN